MADILHKYGLRFNQQLNPLELELFCLRTKRSPEQGGLGPYRHFRNAAQMLYPKRIMHDWATWRFKRFFEWDWCSWAGCASCVAGDTRIFDPVTGESPKIGDLYERQVRPTVMALQGPVLAGVPFIKGCQPLYEIELESGLKFRATAEHRVLLASGVYCHVEDLRLGQFLLSFDLDHLQTTAECGQSVRAEDAPYFQKKAEGYQGSYSAYCDRDDEQPLLEEAVCQSSFPLPNGVLPHSRCDSYAGDPLLECIGIHPSIHSGHLSNLESVPRRNLLGTPELPHCGQEMLERGGYSFQSGEQSRLAPLLLDPSLGPALDFFHKRHFLSPTDSISEALDAKDRGESYIPNYSTQLRVTAISKTAPSLFYDLCVPVAHHYYAEGAIHHNCGKTDDAMFLAFMWWLAQPDQSAVIVTSTTGKMIKKRSWPVLQRLIEEFPGPCPFNLVDSKMTLQVAKGDDKHSISGIGVKEGNISKAVGDIQGHHCPRILVIVDEAEETPQAIYEAFPNLLAGTQEFKVVEIANPESRFSPFGRHIEPVKGWSAVSVIDEEWETKEGICLHFDGEQSPNILAGETKIPFLVTQPQLDAMAKRYGSRESVGYYKFGRGFPAPDGMAQTVVSENALIRSGCFKKLTFISEKTIIAALDPAFTHGGDKCKLQFGEMGDLPDAKTGINLTDEFVIPINPNDPDPPRYQILRHVKEQCDKRGVLPFCFGLDDTSGGVGDILFREWSPKVRRVQFGGMPTDVPVSKQDHRRAPDAYANRVTQLWFNVASFLDAGQLGGLKPESEYVKQFTARQWSFAGRKQVVETKPEYKLRSGESPDDADAVAVLIEVARQLGASPGTATNVDEEDGWEAQCYQANAVYANANYTEAT